MREKRQHSGNSEERESSVRLSAQAGCLEKEVFEEDETHFRKLYGNRHFSEEVYKERVMGAKKRALLSQESHNCGG